MKKTLLLMIILASSTVYSKPNLSLKQQISSITVEEVSREELEARGLAIPETFTNVNYGTTGGTTGGSTGSNTTVEDRIYHASGIIQVARDIVALGEAVYELVKKGRPTNVTEYAPISVVPRDPTTKEYIDPFELEGFSFPVEKNFVTNIKDGTGSSAVTFSYKVLYSYGGSYNGKGRYLTNVIVVPGSVRTSFGWDFNATMKLSGIMNHGTKADPVAGIMITLKYQMNTWSSAFERNDTIHITGNGELKNYNM